MIGFFERIATLSNFDIKIEVHGCTKTQAKLKNLKNRPFVKYEPTYILNNSYPLHTNIVRCFLDSRLPAEKILKFFVARNK